MLTIYDTTSSSLVQHNSATPLGPSTVWIDLINPTPEEDAFVEGALGIDIPTRAEMREIEASSRFYQEGGAAYMTGFVVHDNDKPAPEGSTITFILAGNRLVTVRYADPRAFAALAQRVSRGDAPCNSGAAILTGLIEELVQNMADLIEKVQDEVDRLARGIFDMKARRDRNTRLDVMLKGIGREGDIVARVQESATSLDRVMHYFENVARDKGVDQRIHTRVDAAQRDVNSLLEHLRSLSDRVGFLLNATLGMITTEQNQIIKLFSVMAVMLMPPTLVASVYGMNFHHMPELDWPMGYPVALLLMFISALVPFIYFKRKGWL